MNWAQGWTVLALEVKFFVVSTDLGDSQHYSVYGARKGEFCAHGRCAWSFISFFSCQMRKTRDTDKVWGPQCQILRKRLHHQSTMRQLERISAETLWAKQEGRRRRHLRTELLLRRPLQCRHSPRGQRRPDPGMRCSGFVPVSGSSADEPASLYSGVWSDYRWLDCRCWFDDHNKSAGKRNVQSFISCLTLQWAISNFPCSLTRKITSYSMDNLALFHTYWDSLTATLTWKHRLKISLANHLRERLFSHVNWKFSAFAKH